ncbi:hypothetical protein [Tenacibaculum sp. IB213877]|uniref:hypothetical protein n=1 Tax=Tenacibaculum sp. IB213877 TaxID=3097351 RepID=UPI002A5AA03F|nr:hypothetical protein [Tenacibaculum sp. IB213877]MDY0779999.1 hypothetical protein [Tenacibaculum sp. IB213877]
MKQILFILIFICSLSCFSQSFFESGNLFYRDGRSEKGYLKIKNSKIKFKKKITDKETSELSYKKIKKVIINEDGKDSEYHYKIIKGKKKGKIKLLKVVVVGKASLYKLEHETSLGNPSTFPLSATYNYKGANFYIGNNESNLVEFIGAKSITVGRKSIKKGLLKYFEDCPELVKKIKNKEYKNKDIVEAVEFYNSNCNNK